MTQEPKKWTPQQEYSINAINNLGGAAQELTKLAKVFVRYCEAVPTIEELVDVSYNQISQPTKVIEVAQRIMKRQPENMRETLGQVIQGVSSCGQVLQKY
jgi:hypothetical protein